MIIDIHAHVFPDKIAVKASENTGKFYGLPRGYDGTVSQLTAFQDEAGIDMACIHSVAVTPHSVGSINRFISDTALRNRNRFIGFGAIYPGAEDIPEVISEAKELGLKGFKIHPDIQQFALDSMEAMDMFAELENSGMPVLIHTGDKRFHNSRPEQTERVLRTFPGLTCICAHLGGWSEWDDAVRHLARYENAWFDTSSSLGFITREHALRVIHSYDTDRLMFGTDYPMWRPKEELERFMGLGLTDEENEKILEKNARRLLGI